jgi:Cof subfamily protein (haloacid dehalogenase superfamily)
VQPDIQLLAIDLDGTTVSHDIDISPRVMRAVQAAMAKGVKVVIATGRNVPSTRPFVQRFRTNAPVICQQGGLIYDYAAEKTLHKITLPHGLACELAALEHEHPTWKPVMYQDQRVYVSDAVYFRSLDSLVGFAPIETHDLCHVLDGVDADKILFAMRPEETPAAMQLVTIFVNGRANVVQSHAMFVEINPIGADKGSALKIVAADLGIAQENVMAIGDQGNDATMVEWAGVGVAMGNGNEVTKAVAKWIAPTIDDDGAAVAIEKFILNEE